MPDERRLFIGSDFGTGAGIVPLIGSQNFHEANVIFWRPPATMEELKKHGNPLPFNIRTALERRMTALADWVEQGHTVIVIGTHALHFVHYDGGGYQKNAFLEMFAPLSEVKFVTASGSRVEYCGPPRMKELFNNLLSRMTYQCILEGADLEPLLRVASATAGAVQIVGGYRKLGLGTIFYIPPFSAAPAESKALIDQVAKLPALLKSAPAELLDWVSAYQSNSEKRTREKIAALDKTAAELNAQIVKEQESLAEHGELKQLLCGTGTPFANAVSAALTELSLSVVEGPHSRADLLSAYTNRFIAIEAKGLEGPAKETHLRQVERWSADVNSTLSQPVEEANKDPDLRRYLDQLSKLSVSFVNITEACKGIMIIGTFRTTPLADRSDPDFPDQLLRLLKRSNVCALTGAQLFTLIMQVREKPELKEEIVNEIVGTSGVLARGSNWSEYLQGPETA